MILSQFALYIFQSTSKCLNSTLKDVKIIEPEQENRIKEITQQIFHSMPQADSIKPLVLTCNPLREERVFIEDPSKLSEQVMPDNGNCLFYSIHYWLEQYKTYLVANKLLNGFHPQIPDPAELRIQAVEYLKQNYTLDLELQKIVNFSLQDYNESLHNQFKILLMNYAFLLNEVPKSHKIKSYFYMIDKLFSILNEPRFESMPALKLCVNAYAEDLIGNESAEASLNLVNALNQTLITMQPIDIEKYFDLYKNLDFFGNRDALYALSQIYRINFHIYQKDAGSSSTLLQPGDPRILLSSSSNDIASLKEQMAPLAFMVFRGNNHYNVLD